MAYMVATETFHTATKNGMVSIREGQTLPEGDALVKANPDKFTPQEEWLDNKSQVFSSVEAATAAPGEMRTVAKPKKKVAKKK